MRIVQIGGTLVGAQKEIELSIHNYLKGIKQESIILYAIGDEYDDSNVIRYETKLESYVRRFLWKYYGHNDICAWIQTKRVIRLLKIYQPDIVHLHVIHHGYVCFPMLMKYLIRNKIKVVFTMHDMWSLTGGCYHYMSMGCNQYLAGCEKCPSEAKDFDSKRADTASLLRQKRSLFSQCEDIVFVGVSHWVEEQARKVFPAETKITSIYNAVSPMDEAEFKAAAENPLIQEVQRMKAGRTALIGVAGSWTDKKGIYEFFELARILGEQYWIVLVGNASEKVRQEAPANITFLGYVSNRAVLWNLYQICDLHVSMSLEETFGMTFIEAAINGLMSAGFASTAIPEILLKVNGLIVEGHSVFAMAQKILSQKEKGYKLPQKTIADVCTQFSENTMALTYYNIYNELI